MIANQNTQSIMLGFVMIFSTCFKLNGCISFMDFAIKPFDIRKRIIKYRGILNSTSSVFVFHFIQYDRKHNFREQRKRPFEGLDKELLLSLVKINEFINTYHN